MQLVGLATSVCSLLLSDTFCQSKNSEGGVHGDNSEGGVRGENLWFCERLLCSLYEYDAGNRFQVTLLKIRIIRRLCLSHGAAVLLLAY